MQRATAFLVGVLALGAATADADDRRGLHRSGRPNEVTISGLSSGAAMAVQYAVAHSQTIAGVGSIAGPAWGCADGSLFQAVSRCMCGNIEPHARADLARKLAHDDRIDSLASGTPKTLQKAYVFHSLADAVVKKESAQANITFLTDFIGRKPTVDLATNEDPKTGPGHGILSADGPDPCPASDNDNTHIRRCDAEDNAGRTLHALYDPGTAFDPGKRVNDIPDTEVWTFDQLQLIDRVKAERVVVTDDAPGVATDRRKNFDMATTGYIYVPPVCRPIGSSCRVHVALHGCKQDARTFAMKSGYNNWAEHHRVMIVYPAIDGASSGSERICPLPPVVGPLDFLEDQNPNGCWDWWGYLDKSKFEHRYLTRDAPQIRVIERIIAEVTKPH